MSVIASKGKEEHLVAKDLPYTIVPGKISEVLLKIADAKVPDTFSNAFLRDTLGLKSSNDRNLISLLKSLAILDPSGKPTARYRQLKNSATSKQAIAEGIREAFAPLYEANENAHALEGDDLKGLIAQVAGGDKDQTNRVFYTLNALIKSADFSSPLSTEEDQIGEKKSEQKEKSKPPSSELNWSPNKGAPVPQGFRPEFHYNIQIHLPNNGTEETYLNIFNAIRDAFR
ncbi:MAG: DUF5343 domain-containing protein [Bdellovibrionota bacterium]